MTLFQAASSLDEAGLLACLDKLVADGVTHVDLRGCRMTTLGVVALISQLIKSNATRVVDLCLANTWVSTEGVELLATALRNNTCLERLDLSNTGAQVEFTRGTTQRGLQALSEALSV